MPRPKINAADKLSEHIHFLHTVGGRERLASKSHAYGIAEGEFLRRLIDDAPLPAFSTGAAIDPALVNALNNAAVQLSGLGNNVNQIAHALNRTGRPSANMEDIARTIDDELAKTKAALNACLKAMR